MIRSHIYMQFQKKNTIEGTKRWQQKVAKDEPITTQINIKLMKSSVKKVRQIQSSQIYHLISEQHT